MDEIQKIPAWSESVKRLWDEDTADGVGLRVMLLGSAPLLVQKGLTESLAGRFELIRVSHWSYPEMRDAFGWTLDQYLYFGGYPGAADLIADEDRWSRYLLDSLVETTLARDVLLLTRVDKPALLRQLFRLGCEHSAEVVPYSRMLGRLTDAGNTTTLAHYIDLLAGSGMLAGLPKYDGTDAAARRRASSPKLLALNTALMTAGSGRSFEAARADGQFWGRLAETAVGAHLANGPAPARVGYWRQGGREVDFVVAPRDPGGRPLAIEVTSGRGRDVQPGMAAFERAHPGGRRLQVGGRGMGLEEFLSEPAATWVG
jgi:predicted AAA+ superfamily ATPase